MHIRSIGYDPKTTDITFEIKCLPEFFMTALTRINPNRKTRLIIEEEKGFFQITVCNLSAFGPGFMRLFLYQLRKLLLDDLHPMDRLKPAQWAQLQEELKLTEQWRISSVQRSRWDHFQALSPPLRRLISEFVDFESLLTFQNTMLGPKPKEEKRPDEAKRPDKVIRYNALRDFFNPFWEYRLRHYYKQEPKKENNGFEEYKAAYLDVVDYLHDYLKEDRDPRFLNRFMILFNRALEGTLPKKWESSEVYLAHRVFRHRRSYVSDLALLTVPFFRNGKIDNIARIAKHRKRQDLLNWCWDRTVLNTFCVVVDHRSVTNDEREKNENRIKAILNNHNGLQLMDLTVVGQRKSREVYSLLDVAILFGQSSKIPTLITEFNVGMENTFWYDYGYPQQVQCTTLGLADLMDDSESAKILLDHKANVDYQPPKESKTALHKACEWGRPKFIPLLFEYKANVNAKDAVGKTPLLTALTNNQRECAEMLLGHSETSVAEHDNDGNTALHVVCREGFADFIPTLLERKADINAQDKKKDTPLLLAYMHRQSACVSKLLERKEIKLLPTDSSKNTPLVLAIVNNDEVNFGKVLESPEINRLLIWLDYKTLQTAFHYALAFASAKEKYALAILDAASKNRDILSFMLNHVDEAGQRDTVLSLAADFPDLTMLKAIFAKAKEHGIEFFMQGPKREIQSILKDLEIILERIREQAIKRQQDLNAVLKSEDHESKSTVELVKAKFKILNAKKQDYADFVEILKKLEEIYSGLCQRNSGFHVDSATVSGAVSRVTTGVSPGAASRTTGAGPGTASAAAASKDERKAELPPEVKQADGAIKQMSLEAKREFLLLSHGVFSIDVQPVREFETRYLPVFALKKSSNCKQC